MDCVPIASALLCLAKLSSPIATAASDAVPAIDLVPRASELLERAVAKVP